MALSIIFPHHISKEQNKLLDLKLKMLEENCNCEYEVLYLGNHGRLDLVYAGWDWLIRQAKYPLVLWSNSDIVYSKNFTDNILSSVKYGDWIGLELAECGQIGVAESNIKIDFGITADTFRREEFESWAAEKMRQAKYNWREGFAWYSPSVFKKSWYIEMGGFDLSKSFPHHVDLEFREKVTNHRCRFIVANSYAYHFQRSGENLGEKPERL